jgi:hypothetical protein
MTLASVMADYIEMLDRGEKILVSKTADSVFEQIDLFQEAQ